MSFKSTLLKSIFRAAALSSFGISSLITLSTAAKAEDFNMSACPDSGSSNATIAYILSNHSGQCLHTPEQYKLTIYEMGLCASNPIASDVFSKSNCTATMVSSSGTIVDLAPGSASSKTAPLPAATSRPASNTYTHAYILLGNGFKMKGSYTLSDGSTTFYSKESTDEWGTFGAADSSLTAAQEHTDLVDNMYFGDEPDGWDGVMSESDMPGGGKVSALLLKECTNTGDAAGDTCVGSDGVASSQGEVKRLLGVFETNAGSPVTITDSTNGVEVELVVKKGGYLLWLNNPGSGWTIGGFGSAPFKPTFTTF